MLKNKSTVSVIEWAPGHYAWPLVELHELSIKLEEIPVGGKSEPHYHKKSFQFLFVLEGQAEILLEDVPYQLKKQEGIPIRPYTMHHISNTGDEKLLFLLISSPLVRDDDIYVE